MAYFQFAISVCAILKLLGPHRLFCSAATTTEHNTVAVTRLSVNHRPPISVYISWQLDSTGCIHHVRRGRGGHVCNKEARCDVAWESLKTPLFCTLWKPRHIFLPSTFRHLPPPPTENVIYSIYSHTVALSNVMMTDAWEQSRKRDCKIKYEAIYSNCPVRLIYCNNNEVKFSAQKVRNAFLSWQHQPPQTCGKWWR